MVNETAVKDFGIEDLEKTRFILPNGSESGNLLQVIGVVKNFNFESLHNPIGPYIFCIKNDNMQFGYLSLKLS